MRCGFVAFEESIMRFSRNVIIGAARFMSNGTTATDGKGILKVLATTRVGKGGIRSPGQTALADQIESIEAMSHEF